VPKDRLDVCCLLGKVHINLKKLFFYTLPHKEERSQAGVFVVFVVVAVLFQRARKGLPLLLVFFFFFCFCARKVCLRN